MINTLRVHLIESEDEEDLSTVKYYSIYIYFFFLLTGMHIPPVLGLVVYNTQKNIIIVTYGKWVSETIIKLSNKFISHQKIFKNNTSCMYNYTIFQKYEDNLSIFLLTLKNTSTGNPKTL